MKETQVTLQVNPEEEKAAMQRARDKALIARWDLNIAIVLFGVLIVVLILLFQDVQIEVVAPVAIFGLVTVWMIGWRRGRKLFKRFYEEEIAGLNQEYKQVIKKTIEKTIEETIEEKVQKALRERWR